MARETTEYISEARKLLDDFFHRTGVGGNREPVRYLWTDAFAVRCYLGLFRTSREERDRQRALELVKQVHEVLGRFAAEDHRTGWISGFSREEGSRHPTVGGLRIGKKLPERRKDQDLDQQLEWDRDGQYFHYLTQWAHALLKVYVETGDQKYALWASELMQAGSKFIGREMGQLRMYWKMSIDLSRPLVQSMGAHDPLEGLLLTRKIQETSAIPVPDLKILLRDFTTMCMDRDWKTSDPLGTGGLLLNSVRATGLGLDSPDSVQPQNLLEDSLYGLNAYAGSREASRPSGQRLAFRECGLSLGLAVLFGTRDLLKARGLPVEPFERHFALKEETEDFWLNPGSQGSITWTSHLDINAVSLAASLIAEFEPTVFK